MIEREMQELIWQHPERFLHEPLKQFAWEPASDVGRADLVFEDRHGRLLIIEVKHGKLPRGAINQLLDYFGMMKQRFPDKAVELMVVANSIPSERRLTCESRDIECREISEKIFRDVATELGYTFASELALQKASEKSASAQPPSTRDANPHGKGSWLFNKTTHSGNSIRDFLSRCDPQGSSFFTALFNGQQAASKQTKITWDHESGFSMQFYFNCVGFVPMVWGFPATNREGRSVRERLAFPFDRAAKAGVSEDFINEFGASLSALVPLSGGSKRPSVAVGTLTSPEAEEILRAIFHFAEKAAKTGGS